MRAARIVTCHDCGEYCLYDPSVSLGDCPCCLRLLHSEAARRYALDRMWTEHDQLDAEYYRLTRGLPEQDDRQRQADEIDAQLDSLVRVIQRLEARL